MLKELSKYFTTKSIMRLFPISNINNELEAVNYKIVLDDEVIVLKEIVINPLSETPKDYGFFNLKSNKISLSGKYGSRLCVFVENIDKIAKVIQTVNLKIKKTNDKIKIRLFFCSKLDHNFIVNNLNNDDIIVSDFPKKDMKIDVSKYSIPFPEDGIYIGIELINVDGKMQNMYENIGLDFKCTSKNKTQSTWIYQNNKWEQFPSLTDEDLDAIPKIFRLRLPHHTQPNHPHRNR